MGIRTNKDKGNHNGFSYYTFDNRKSVNFATELATVIFDPAQANVEQMVQKVDTVGYKATPLVVSTRNLF